MGFGENLKRYRYTRGLTQQEFGRILGCNGTTISKYERGTQKPRVNKLIQYAQQLNCSVVDLTGTEGIPIDQCSIERETPNWSTLKALRKNKGLYQYQLAQKIGITQGKLSAYERGEATPENHIMVKLAAALDVPVGFLIRSILAENA